MHHIHNPIRSAPWKHIIYHSKYPHLPRQIIFCHSELPYELLVQKVIYLILYEDMCPKKHKNI